MKKKIRCKNCGTTLKETDMSCPICHMIPDRTVEEKKEVEEKIVHKKNNSIIWKYGLISIFVIGLVMTLIGFLHMKDVTYCSNEECTTKNLFMLLFGLTLTITSLITFIRNIKK